METAVLEQLVRGEEAALSVVMTHLGPDLQRLAGAILGDWHQAEEAVQDAFMRLWKGRSRVQPDKIPFWLRTVVRNLCIDRLRRRKPPTESLDSPVALRAAAEPTFVDDLAGRDALRRGMESLSPGARRTLSLWAAGYGYRSIGEGEEVPLGTVKSRIAHARRQLRRVLRSA